MDENVTKTLPTIMFLLVLEPNLGILCVSIPMLRPLYSIYRKRSGGSRLKDVTDERTAGYGSNRSGQKSGVGTTSNAGGVVGNTSTWEMEDFYRPDVIKHDTTVTAPGDESGSERNLTTSPLPVKTTGAIRVDTVWTMTRS